MSDIVTINTNGLDEAIRCAICENTMKTDNGCDGNCRYDKSTFEKVKEAVNGCIVERPHGEKKKEKTETNERNCANCKHYKLYKEDIFACESWECKYEPRDKED